MPSQGFRQPNLQRFLEVVALRQLALSEVAPNASVSCGWNGNDYLLRSMIDHLIAVISLAIAASKSCRAEWCSPIARIAQPFSPHLFGATQQTVMGAV